MIVIVDIDNTLAINKIRFNLAKKDDGKIDWDIAYKSEYIEADLPNYPMIDLVKKYKSDGFEIIIFTSRPEFIKMPTELWLKKYNIHYDKLYMRPLEYHTIDDVDLKKQMYEKYINDDVFCAFDDSQKIIDLWLSLGIPCFKVYV